MIAYLSGTTLKKTDKGIILDTGNVGYFVHLSKQSLAETEISQGLELFTHQQIREDSSELYGFANFEDLLFFKKLININGIGPKVAMEIMNFPPLEISKAIEEGNTTFLGKIPGIGKKTASRLILELKGKIDNFEGQSGKVEANLDEDILEALIRLGYSRSEIHRALKTLPTEIKETTEIISYFLKHVR